MPATTPEPPDQPDIDVPERDWIARIRAGDQAAMEQLFRRYYAELVDFAAAFVPARDAAEDAVCSVFASLVVRHAEWAPSTGIRPYLFRAVRNRCASAVRDKWRRPESTLHLDDESLAADVPLPDAVLVDHEDREQRLEAIDRALATLPRQARALITLRWRDGLPLTDIAQILGVSLGAAKMQVSRALAELRRRLPVYLK